MRVFDFPPSDLMRPRYCRSADSRMRMQNALLLVAVSLEVDAGTAQSKELGVILKKKSKLLFLFHVLPKN